MLTRPNDDAEKLDAQLRPKRLPPPLPGQVEINPFSDQDTEFVVAALRGYFAEHGRQGGKSKSDMKMVTARKNSTKGGRPLSKSTPSGSP